MAKDLPYFKFYCSEWSDGDISLEDMQIQGLFVNICSYYWSNEGVLTLSKCKKKFKLVDEKDFNTLIESKIIKIDSNDNIIINFLNEQLQERDNKSIINKLNGAKGGRPTQNKPKENQTETETKPNGYFSLTETEPKQKAIREEEKREDKKRKENNIVERDMAFYNALTNFKDLYSKELLRAFYDYWREKNKSCTKMKFELEDTWQLDLRLKKWQNNESKFSKNVATQQTNVSPPSQYKKHEN